MSGNEEGSAEISRLKGEGLLRYVERQRDGISNQDEIDRLVAADPSLAVVPEDAGKAFLEELHKNDPISGATASNWEDGQKATGSTAQVMNENAKQIVQTEIGSSTRKK
jgi:hypothetical protein